MARARRFGETVVFVMTRFDDGKRTIDVTKVTEATR
jgi:hypothetical protein